MFTFQAKLIAAALVASLVLGSFGWLLVSRANLKADLAQVRADVSLCQTANQNWKTLSDMASAVIDKMAAEADARKKAAVIAQKRAASASEPIEAHAATLIALKPSGEACVAAQRLIHDFLVRQK